jgi:hypothetical protein
MEDQKAKDILDLLSVPGFKELYILGCFARCVTLYSQQVRALNLVSALGHTGVIKPGAKVIVIGAGASGITASAAAALLGADVTLLDELEGPMELQYNNRQRWIHPYVYDWPKMERMDDDSTRLPILNWTATYADRVAEQIEAGWSAVVQETKRIRPFWRATAVSIQEFKGSTYVTWHAPDTGPGYEHDAVTILAVGFGLEDQQEWAWSYWSEDDIDGSFRKPAQRPKWLVSGYGDGALTDVMRLAIRRFRHHEIMQLFENSNDVDSVKRDLIEIQEKSKSAPVDWVHDRFFGLATGDLGEKLKTRLRKEGPEVHLTSRSPFIYAPGSSILNRLVVLLLQKAGAVQYVPGEPAEFNHEGRQIRGGTGAIKAVPGGFQVDLAKGAQFYNRVIFRHGPFASPHPRLRESFMPVYAKCAPLIAVWDRLAPIDDPTRTPNWSGDFLKEKRPVTPVWDNRRQYQAMRTRLGVQAKAMSVYKEIRGDGGSVVSYEIDELSVNKGRIEGVWCRVKFTAGVIGVPSLNAAAVQLGMQWIPEVESPPPGPEDRDKLLEETIERGSRISGTLKFARPLRAGDPAVSFGFSVEVLNGDALSIWEFQEMYPEPADRLHINREPVNNLEYFGRIVWFPVETLRMRLKLPEKITVTPSVSVFECSRRTDITRKEVAPDSILHLYPSPESLLSPRSVEWKRRDYPARSGETPLARASDNFWDVSVWYPPVGNCYSIDFELGSSEAASDSASTDLAQEARAFRNRLVTVAGPYGAPVDPFREAVRDQLRALNEHVGQFRLGPDEAERFELMFTTYDDNAHRMIMVDGLLNGGEPTPDMWTFRLPFGVGLAGVTFKQGDRVFFHVNPDEGREAAGPDFYIELPRRPRDCVLVSVPLDHPHYRSSLSIERSRQCVGVINLLSTNEKTGLKHVTENKAVRDELWKTCQVFCRAIWTSRVGL